MKLFQLRSTLLLCSTIALAAPSQAQVEATATVRSGCVVPGPADSLRAAPTVPPVFLPNATGAVVLECEEHEAIGSWAFETVLPGFSGDGYFRWNGPNFFNTPGTDTLSYAFQVDTPGSYVMRIWSQQTNPDSTLENDVWARVDDGTWEKVFGFQVGVWNPNAIVEDTGQVFQVTLGAGLHTLQLSGRSNNFRVDRADIIPASIFYSDGNQSGSEVALQRPVLGAPFTVEVDDPTGSSGVAPGGLAILLLGNGIPCGTVLPELGELLIGLPALLDPLVGVWNGPGQPSPFTIDFPTNPALVGVELSFQAALFQPDLIVLTDALDLRLGDL